MKDSARAFIAVLLSFICSIAALKMYVSGAEIAIPLVLIGVNMALHFVYAARRRISLATLPAAWACCIAPLYIYSHTIANAGISERRFAFLVLLVIMWGPVFAASLLTSVITYCLCRHKMSKSGGSVDKD